MILLYAGSGDEFIILLPKTKEDDVFLISERIKNASKRKYRYFKYNQFL